MWTVKIITAYPAIFPGVLEHSVIGKALKNKIWSLEIINLHKFGHNERNSIDDTLFGGGPGMLIRPDVVENALDFVQKKMNHKLPLIYTTPCGKPLKQLDLVKFSKEKGVVILCGRFEGVDTRAIDNLGFQRISIGDYILSGGEAAAQVIVEGCIRLLPGVLGHSESILEESFSQNLLEYPQFTRPQVWKDKKGKKHNVPDILVSGHHKKIKEWRKNKSIEVTRKFRPDLIKKTSKENKNKEE